MPQVPLYIRKQAGFYEKTDQTVSEPEQLKHLFTYQPTPEGVALLCQHYSDKYAIDLQCVDFREEIDVVEKSLDYFSFLANKDALLSLEEGQQRGLILSHGQNHAIPVLIQSTSSQTHMIVFDSSSGASIKGYSKIAALFPNVAIYLNQGTRQSDGLSCITDAICILKEALQVEDLLPQIQDKVVENHDAFRRTRFFNQPKPDNFHVFKMPEKLLLTAQVSAYLTQADANLEVLLRGDKSLGEYREQFRMTVILLKNSAEITTINSYLYTKSIEHRFLLDFLSLQQAATSEAQAEEKDADEPDLLAQELERFEMVNGTQSRKMTVPSPRYCLSPSNLSFYSIANSSHSPDSPTENLMNARAVSR